MMDIETVTSRLYEDASLTEDLIDEEAKKLLQWAETQLPDLIAKYPDETAFDEAFKALRTMVKGMNRFVGQRASMDETEKQDRLGKIASAAVTLGFNPTAAVGSAQVARHEQEQSNMDVLEDLLRLFSPATAAPQAAEPVPSPNLPAPAPAAPAPVEESFPEVSEEPPAGHFARFLKDIFNDKKEQ
jgi:hypothetical protein